MSFAPIRGNVLGQRCNRLSRYAQRRRSFAVYAVGEGWTGALGTGRLDERISGHFDEEDADDDDDMPVEMYDKPVRSISVGWGHTAVITQDKRLLLTGRPHDFSSLMRLRRLPAWLRNYSVKQTLRSTQDTDDRGVDPTSLVGRFVSWLTDTLQIDYEDWDSARLQSLLPTLTEIHQLPDQELPKAVVCSAGFTAVVSESGAVYTFGLNGFGQCGIGATSNNVWQPKRVTGLTSDFADRPRAEMEQSHPIENVCLGLQHGLCLNGAGEVFAWGKGERGQLGQEMVMGESHTALPIPKYFHLDDKLKPIYKRLGSVQQVAAGMIHSAALTEDNKVLVWGKNTLPSAQADESRSPAGDARLPMLLQGLPNLKVKQIACGSHHTAILMSDGSVWAVGVSSDTKEPIHEPVLMIQPGVIEMPVRQFAAHMDRTTIVGADGRQVLQVHLWKDPELQEYAVFTPNWIDRLLEDPAMKIQQVHRSWMHSVIVTE